jgi:hypothetical protein
VPAQLHSSTAATTDQNGYIPHTTTFWNSGAQFHSGIVAESIVPSYTPPATPTSIQQRNSSRPKRLPTYLNTTAFWNSDHQFHSGMVTESIIPPAPAAHNTIAFINPDATYQSACLPTYHNILELWWPVPFRNHLTTINSGKLKAENPELSAAEQKRQNVRRTYEHTRVGSSSSTFSASTQITLSFQKKC